MLIPVVMLDRLLNDVGNEVVSRKDLCVLRLVAQLSVQFNRDGRLSLHDLENIFSELVSSTVALRVYRYDRHIQKPFELLNIYCMLLLLKNIDHRQRDDNRYAKFKQLCNEI